MGRISRVEKNRRLQEQLEQAVAEERRLKCKVSTMTDQIETLDDQIKDLMRQLGSEKQQAGNYMVHFHPKADYQRFDAKKYQADHADLVKPYMVTVPGGMYFSIV